jgi:hypothetical protein
LLEWSASFHGCRKRYPQSKIHTARDHLHLTVVKGYLRKLITNDRVARYLEQYQPELFIEFQKIAVMTSTLPSEAA